MDRERVARLVGRKVAVGLRISEGQSAEVVATLDEVRDDGVVLSEISDLGSGPKLFCPRDSLKRVGIRPPSLGPVHEEPEPDEEPQEQEYYELYELREAPTEELAFEPPQRDQPSARRLNRVVPIGQRRTVGEVVVALTSLEIFDDGLHAYLIDVQRQCYEVGEHIHEEFFAHRPLTAEEVVAG